MEKYYRKTIVLLLLFSLLQACYSISESPDDLLSKGDMEDILYDIYLYNNYQIAVDEYLGATQTDVKKEVLKKHQVPEAVFDSSMKYYYLRPKTNKEILESVLEKVEKQQKKLEEKQNNEKK